MRSQIVPLALLALAVATALSGPAGARDPDYRYCHVSQENDGGSGYTYYFSRVFAVPDDTYNTGIQNSFNSFTTARFDPDIISGAQCMGPYDSFQEAEDKMNDHIGDVRRNGWDVVMTDWRYRGD